MEGRVRQKDESDRRTVLSAAGSRETTKQQRRQLNPTTRAQINILGRLDGWYRRSRETEMTVVPGDPGGMEGRVGQVGRVRQKDESDSQSKIAKRYNTEKQRSNITPKNSEAIKQLKLLKQPKAIKLFQHGAKAPKFPFNMKSYTKAQLADAAGVSIATFRRWLKSDEEFLHANNINVQTKLLPPKVVRYLCEKYCIDLPR